LISNTCTGRFTRSGLTMRAAGSRLITHFALLPEQGIWWGTSIC
jgi:hypothetical protein